MTARDHRFRPRPALDQQITALQRPRPPDGSAREFVQGALAALRWLLAEGPAPLTGTFTGQPPPPASVAAELAATDKLIYHWRPSRREYGRGVQQALMWAQYATATPPSPSPSPTLRSPRRTNR